MIARLRALLARRTLFLTGTNVTILCETRTQAEQLFDLLEGLSEG